MQTILLKRKPATYFTRPLVNVYDDLTPGLISGGFYTHDGTGIMRPIEDIIEDFQFPKGKDGSVPRIVSFITGHSPELAKKIEYYEA